MSGNTVKLNVGGTVFETLKSTLTKHDGFFKALIETDVPAEKDDSNCFFIDRSPKHFETVLNYMRSGDVVLPDSKKDMLELKKEAEYYLLSNLAKLCQPPTDNFKTCTPEELMRVVANTDKKVIMINYLTYNGRTESQYPEDGPFPNEKPYWTFLVYNSTRSGRRPFRHTVDLEDCMGHM
ncbi:BTB domain-containing protein [Caenorhabditis elegans]|uniref:BTB domain-containing protein n=1 Tax=Caenorhabditis elegans TaxID=6239 RepID=H2KY83_CAEEL|nr:BTB domain-containing protein [Caenorhabditis elegans]CCD61639.1 BTB domain-containing protein [Caenorhabditis elegans]|eukprot:NP_001122573.1 Uncharacterized protein CELE_B0281.5 [Caenorhabditis elegans]